MEIDRLTAVINDNKADVVIGVGGGKIFDTAKAAAYYADKPVIICPTIAATDAPCSALSVIYTPDGAVESYLFLRQNPDMVIMDSAVIAKSPVRLTVSGMAGVTEPAIYGITLPKKAPFIRTCIIAGIAGGVLGLAGVRCFAMASMGVFAFPGMINPATNDTKGMIICIVVAFASLALGVISELLFYKDDEPAKKTETKAAAAGDGVQSEDFVSPMTGEAIELSQVKDEVFSVRHISDRIAVMYLGKIVEIAGTDELYDNPLHPYTKALLSAIPDPEPDSGWLLKRVPLTGEITGSGEMRGGCAFAQRCPLATEECMKIQVSLARRKRGT